MNFLIRSPAFRSGEPIPRRHTGDADDISPALSWSEVPSGTAELVLVVDDPDAPTPEPWVHWILYKIPPASQGLPEGFHGETVPTGHAALRQGLNSWGSLGYRGPAPPRGHGLHHYHFTLYAVDRELKVPPDPDKKAILQAMTGRILARAELVGTYQR